MTRYARPFLIFAFLAAIYFWDVFAYGLSLAVGDGMFQFYPALYAACEQYWRWQLPLWYEYVFSGFPLMAATQGATLYPQSLLAVPYGISSIDGYDSLLNRDYARLRDMETNGFSYEWADLIRGNLILSMLNARYLVVDEALGGGLRP